MKLTQEQIEEIRKRAEAATPGNWEYQKSLIPRVLVDGDLKVSVYSVPEDAIFVANARQDIPALLDHIAELQAENKALKSDACMWRNLRLEASARIAELQSQEAMNDDEE